MTDGETRIKVDISFNITSGDSAARLIQVSLQCYCINMKNCIEHCPINSALLM